jgi:hypothetical protein
MHVIQRSVQMKMELDGVRNTFERENKCFLFCCGRISGNNIYEKLKRKCENNSAKFVKYLKLVLSWKGLVILWIAQQQDGA